MSKNHLLMKGRSRPLYSFIFVISKLQWVENCLMMLLMGFEPQTSCVGGDCSTSWAAISETSSLLRNLRGWPTIGRWRLWRESNRGNCVSSWAENQLRSNLTFALIIENVKMKVHNLVYNLWSEDDSMILHQASGFEPTNSFCRSFNGYFFRVSCH